MDSWMLLPRPERITELYFNGSRPSPEDQRQTISFTVHNLEHRDTTYYYEVTTGKEGDKAARKLSSGTFALSHDRSMTVNKTIVMPRDSERAAINVNLHYAAIVPGDDKPHDQQQSIRYWIDINSPGKDGKNHEKSS